jgi:hypothetical protein
MPKLPHKTTTTKKKTTKNKQTKKKQHENLATQFNSNSKPTSDIYFLNFHQLAIISFRQNLRIQFSVLTDMGILINGKIQSSLFKKDNTHPFNFLTLRYKQQYTGYLYK